MIFKDLKETEEADKMAALLSQITYGCGDCSPDSREQCEKCLNEILLEELDEFLQS